MLSPDVVRSFFCTSLSSRDFWTAVAERFADASASDTDAALATTDRSSRSVSGVPATLALPPTLIPGLPLAGYATGWVDEVVAALVEAVTTVPPARVAPMR